MKKLVLASSSPYRKAMLEKLHLTFEVAKPEIDESKLTNESPLEQARRLSLKKAQALASEFPDHLIIGSDQVAIIGDTQLTKPGDFSTAKRQLSAMSGKPVYFHSGICLLNSKTGDSIVELETTTVHFKPLTPEQIDCYLELEKPFDCAGSFKSEALGIALVERFEGNDPNALVGFPIIKLIRMLEQFGVTILGH